MSTFGRKFGSTRRMRSIGRPREVESPGSVVHQYNDFSGAYNSSLPAEQLPAQFSPFMEDFEVTPGNRLKRMPGTEMIDILSEDVKQVELQSSLDNRSEVLLFAPPLVGVKQRDILSWENPGLKGKRSYALVNYGGTAIFSNGVGHAFVKQADELEIEKSKTITPFRAAASFAARLVLGATDIDGRYEPLGVKWSAANGDYEDFKGTGAGFELLINDMSMGDRIVAMRSIGLDFMAILMNNSIWIGRRTRLVDRPIDFQPRFTGSGALNHETCRTTRFGVMYLSMTGVQLFDGNVSTMISEPINNDLLPIDLEQLDHYAAAYDPQRSWYYLFTPVCTWIYDMMFKRWYRREMIARGAVPYAEQFNPVTWADLEGTWEDQEGRWSDYSPEQGDIVHMELLGETDGQMTLVKLNDEIHTAFEKPVLPKWESGRPPLSLHNALVSITQLNLRYTGEGSLNIKLMDNNGEYVLARLIELPESVSANSRVIPLAHTGLGVGVRFELLEGDIEIIEAQLVVKPRGPRVEA